MKQPTVWIVYDGECPVCTVYCRYVRLREVASILHLVDAREGGPLLDEITRRGWDIDEGMVVKVDDAWYYGAAAIHVLTQLTTRQGWRNRLNAWSFATPQRARINYALGKAARNLVLRLLGVRRINNLGMAPSSPLGDPR